MQSHIDDQHEMDLGPFQCIENVRIPAAYFVKSRSVILPIMDPKIRQSQKMDAEKNMVSYSLFFSAYNLYRQRTNAGLYVTGTFF